MKASKNPCPKANGTQIVLSCLKCDMNKAREMFLKVCKGEI